MRVHISANVKVFTGERHRSCPVVVYTDTQTDTRTDRTTNLIISSNVHFVSLAEIIRFMRGYYDANAQRMVKQAQNDSS